MQQSSCSGQFKRVELSFITTEAHTERDVWWKQTCCCTLHLPVGNRRCSNIFCIKQQGHGNRLHSTQTHTHRHTDTQAHRHRHTGTGTQTQTQTHRHRHRHRHTCTGTGTDTHRHTHSPTSRSAASLVTSGRAGASRARLPTSLNPCASPPLARAFAAAVRCLSSRQRSVMDVLTTAFARDL